MNNSSDQKPVAGALRDDALKEKTVIITGGGTGLGKAMGMYFLKLGANLVITSRKYDVLKETAAEMEAVTGGKVKAIACDVRKYDEVEKMLQTAIDAFGRVDVLLNNAAGNFISPTERLSANAFSAIIDIVLRARLTAHLLWASIGLQRKYPVLYSIL